MRTTPPTPAELDEITRTCDAIRARLSHVLSGKPEVVRTTLAVLLAEGHLLVEDVPGVGKTTLARALARTLRGTVGRVQFTPDLLPGDLTGMTIYRTHDATFEFRPGPIFANVVIGDEINRASPKTQSALLQCMEEHQVTVDGTTHDLPRPFLVVATQNPLEMEGTYPLPEAQRDRFTACISVGYPSADAELEMLERRDSADPLDELEPVTDVTTLARLVDVVHHVFAAEAVKRYAIDVVRATRTDADVRLGASPRASVQLLRVARAVAALGGRAYVTPDDVQALAGPVLAHRIVVSPSARASGRTAADVVTDVLARVPVPVPARR